MSKAVPAPLHREHGRFKYSVTKTLLRYVQQCKSDGLGRSAPSPIRGYTWRAYVSPACRFRLRD